MHQWQEVQGDKRGTEGCCRSCSRPGGEEEEKDVRSTAAKAIERPQFSDHTVLQFPGLCIYRTDTVPVEGSFHNTITVSKPFSSIKNKKETARAIQ